MEYSERVASDIPERSRGECSLSARRRPDGYQCLVSFTGEKLALRDAAIHLEGVSRAAAMLLLHYLHTVGAHHTVTTEELLGVLGELGG